MDRIRCQLWKNALTYNIYSHQINRKVDMLDLVFGENHWEIFKERF